tara:strand:- start:2015 stop:2251 length:237 start_codon:yes stop_codon:yes gene_type:complete
MTDEEIKKMWHDYPSIKRRLKDRQITQREIVKRLWSLGIDVDTMTINRCLNTQHVDIITNVAEQLIVEQDNLGTSESI